MLATLFGVAAVLLLLEVALRFYNPLQARIRGNRIVLATNGSWRIRNDVIRRLPSEIRITRNSIGFRGAEPTADLDRRLSIVTIGGSTTQCFFLPDDETWTARLGKNLEASFPSIWINNAGLDGHSTHGHLVLLEDIVVGLHPKVAIFLVGLNDMARASFDEFEAEHVRSGIFFGSVKGFVKSLSPYSDVVALFPLMYRSYFAYRLALLSENIDLRRQGTLDVPEAAHDRAVDEMASAEYLTGHARRLQKIVDASRRAGIEPIFVTQPLLVGVGTDDVTGVDLARIRVDAEPLQTGQMYWDAVERYNSVTRRVGREDSLLVIDLARQLPKSSRYFYDFFHYTPDGARAVADIVGRALCPTLQATYPEYATQPCARE